VSDEICLCGHRKSQHEDNGCSWWKCHCRKFESLTAETPKPQREEPKHEPVRVEEPPQVIEILSAEVATAHEVEERKPLEEPPHAGDILRSDVPVGEVEELRAKLRAAQEEIERLRQLQDGNHMAASRLDAENNQLREALGEIKRLVEAILARST
jgi:hypothetical protein